MINTEPAEDANVETSPVSVTGRIHLSLLQIILRNLHPLATFKSRLMGNDAGQGHVQGVGRRRRWASYRAESTQ